MLRASLVTTAAALALTGPAAIAQTQASTRAPNGACAALRNFSVPQVRLTATTDFTTAANKRERVHVPHCRVSGLIGRSVAFSAILPNSWNGRMLMGGNGGYAGTINIGSLSLANDGYLTISTNTGHEHSPAGGARWALNDPERQIDFGYLAVHQTALVGKALAKAFYGSEPRYSYFSGCSNGGRQGLMEAERYPDDFNGIVSGAPAAHMSRTGASFLKNLRAVYPDTSYFHSPIITQANLDLLSSKVLGSCDALDGVRDGILNDPRDCRFKLSSIKTCPRGVAGSDCLTKAQRKAIAAIYGPTTDRAGKVIYPGQPLGGENLENGWPAWIIGPDTALIRMVHAPSIQGMFMIEGARYFLFNDSTWDYSRYHGSWVSDAATWKNILDADNPDLSGFLGRGGKLILWHGWSDPALNPLSTIDYYRNVLRRNSNARNGVRLFMEPGVLHCGDGPGPSDVSWLSTITNWVESARAPESVIATAKDSTGKTVRSRPLCAYPRRAVYLGKGNTDDASSFACRDSR
jgi:Tannase and feruloyl esterase